MSYTPMSDLGQQGLFDITRTLLQQPDLASLSEALSQLVKQSALADNAAIVLWQAQTQRASYYTTHSSSGPIAYEDETVLAHGPIRRILSRPDTLHCNYAEFSETWPQLACCRCDHIVQAPVHFTHNLDTTAYYHSPLKGGFLVAVNLPVLMIVRGAKKSFHACKPLPKLSQWLPSKFKAG